MKTFFLAQFFVLALITAKAQTSFTISGQVRGLDSGIARLNYIADLQTKQLSADIHQGRFVFKGSLPEPEYLQISFSTGNGERETSFFSGNEQVELQLDTAQWATPLISGSGTQKEFELYKQLTNSVNEKSNALNKEGLALYTSGKLDDKTRDSLFRVHDQLDLERRIIIADFANAHSSSPVSAWAVSIYYGYEPDLAELLPVYHSLSKQNQQSLYGKQIAEIISSAEKTGIGSAAPDFTLSDPAGKPVSLHGYRGKYVLVDFWASWCGPCRAENPNVVSMYRKYHSGKFEILGVSLDNNRELWVKAIQKDNLQWRQASDLKAWNSDIVRDYGIKGIPFNILLDMNGKIIARNLRGAELQKTLSGLFDQKDTATTSLK